MNVVHPHKKQAFCKVKSKQKAQISSSSPTKSTLNPHLCTFHFVVHQRPQLISIPLSISLSPTSTLSLIMYFSFLCPYTKKGWEKLSDGRKNKPEYAERAVLEAMVNHFIHRDYTVMGSEVHLDVYDDRLTITSPGGMYSGQTVQDLSLEEIASDRRNPILADVMVQLDYMEKRGSGLKRICIYNKSLRLVLLHVFVLSIKKQTVPTLPYRDCCMLDHSKTYRISV